MQGAIGGVNDLHGAGMGEASAGLPIDGHQFIILPQAPPTRFAPLSDLKEEKQRGRGKG